MTVKTDDAATIGVGRICAHFSRLALRRPRPLSAVVAAMVFDIAVELIKPWPIKVLVDNVLGSKPLTGRAGRILAALPGAASRDGLLTWTVGATVAIFVVGWCVTTARTYADIGFGQRLVYDVAEQLLDRLQRLSLGFHARQGVGDSIRRVTGDSACASVIVNDALLPVVSALVTLVLMFLIMWRLDHGLTLLAAAVVPVMVFVLARYSSAMLERSYERQEAEGAMYDTVEQTLSSIPAVQAFALEERMDRRMAAATDTVLAATVAEAESQFRFKVGAGLATAAGTAAIVWFGARQVLEGHLTVGTILVFLSYLTSLYAPLAALMYTSSTLQQAAGSGRRVLEVLDAEPEVADRRGATVLPPVAGHVRIEKVSFGYDAGRPVLREVSLEARPGEVVAIVGATGAGKSTLVGLVPRFFDPQGGRVSIDGHDVRDVTLASLRSQISLVLQDSFLFPVSVAANIAYGRPEASRAEVEAAARAANAHGFVVALPDGYDTVLGERGATLSGGERQRLSIARALLKDAPILILDEPTSALDAATESLLLDALRRLMAGRTTLIIAHRLSTIRDADRIVVLDGGAVAEAGTHHQLMARAGRYANLQRLQNGAPVGVDR